MFSNGATPIQQTCNSFGGCGRKHTGTVVRGGLLSLLREREQREERNKERKLSAGIRTNKNCRGKKKKKKFDIEIECGAKQLARKGAGV